MSYRRLVIDPRAFKPISDNIDISIYNDAIEAVYDAYEYVYIESEKKLLDKLLVEIKRNKRGHYK